MEPDSYNTSVSFLFENASSSLYPQPTSPYEANCTEIVHRLINVSYGFRHNPIIGMVITILYVVVITFGAIGNFLVILAVVRNPAMRTPRNFFIVNQAMSDFLLCTVTVPFNMRYTLILFWDLGDIACRLVASAQGVNIFVSSMSLTAIALDRYLVILFPTRRTHQRTLMAFLASAVWAISILLASPCFFVTTAKGSIQPWLNKILHDCNIDDFYVCQEEENLWHPLPLNRNTYTVACFVIQYFLPLFALSFVYARIGCRMQARLKGPGQSACQDRRRSVQMRQRRTNVLLASLVATFAAAWLPINIYNTLIVFGVLKYKLAIFAICHIAGMVSACANPILYGQMNENFRTEFEAIFDQLGILSCLRKIKSVWKHNGSPRSRRGTADGVIVNTKQSLLSPIKNLDERESLLSRKAEVTHSFQLTPQPKYTNGALHQVSHGPSELSPVSTSSSNHEIML